MLLRRAGGRAGGRRAGGRAPSAALLRRAGTLANDLLVSAARGHALAGAATQRALAAKMARAGVVSPGTPLPRALAKLDRAAFVPPPPGRGGESGADDQRNADAYLPYENRPNAIGHGMTISTPQFHGEVLELLAHRLTPGAAALDVGTGTGYVACVMAMLVAGDGGRVHASDCIAPLVERAERTARRLRGGDRLGALPAGVCTTNNTDSADAAAAAAAAPLRDAAPIHFETDAEIMTRGHTAAGPGVDTFDAIYVAPAVETRAHVETLGGMLRPGGAMVVPVQDLFSGAQTLYRVTACPEGSGALRHESVGPVACQPMLKGDALAQARAPPPPPPLARSQEVAAAKAALEAWKTAFEAAEGRGATRADLTTDPEAKALFARFVAASKLGSV